jgi:hypothetical protein
MPKYSFVVIFTPISSPLFIGEGFASPEPEQESNAEVIKDLNRSQLLVFAEQLAQPELCYEERLDMAVQLRELFGLEQVHPPPRTEQSYFA